MSNRIHRLDASPITECTYCGPGHVCDIEHDGCCSQCCHAHGPCRVCILDELAQDAEMGGITRAHRPHAPKSTASHRPKPASLFARLFTTPPLSGWEQFFVWLMVAIVMVIGWKMHGLFELGLVR